MPVWTPEKVWEDQDVYIIGGGNSLKHFDFSLLHNKCTVGCNDAYKHGVITSKVCIFGDTRWFNTHKDELDKYGGPVFTSTPALSKSRIPWLWTLPRKTVGCHKDALGWNFNTGACATNLAVLLGAKKVYLLGFDMQLIEGESNWHHNSLNKPDADIYPKFIEGFVALKKDMDKMCPEVEVINITDDSALDLYPKIGVTDFWKGN